MHSIVFMATLLVLSGGVSATCGQVIELPAHNGNSQRYALTHPAGKPDAALVLLAGGGGRLALDASGCPTALAGNSLVRMRSLFLAAGFATAYVDAPSDHAGEDGLGAFRATPAHADDLGRVIRDLRQRTGAAVWVIGTSRGAISAANAASRLQGTERPDGVVLTSPVSIGTPQGRKSWTAQTVFDTPLSAIQIPLLAVGHAADACQRSPANLVERIVSMSTSERRQSAIVEGGPGTAVAPGLAACEGRSPHGFLEQETEVVAGIARFVRGERY